MRWFENHKKSTTIGLILFTLVVVIAFSYANSDSSTPFGRGAKTVLTTIQKPFMDAANGVKSAFRGIVQFKSVVRENESLKEEIARLNSEIIDIKLTKDEINQLDELSKALNYESVRGNYNYVTGNVIAVDGSNWFNIFTINKGSDDGIKKDSIVASGEGLVGRIMEVGSNWARVISIMDESNSVSFKTLRDTGLLGILAGDGEGGLKGYMLNSEFMIVKGDQLITSGMGLYPEGIPVGKVTKVSTNEDSLLKEIVVEPAASLKNLQKVFVIVSKT